ncbi:MAG: HAD hydrolase-like protein [Ignavibacteriaceae bacterium]|nr:HAD hydrolase-like protein [Ignavibacteriaceae bacterium]
MSLTPVLIDFDGVIRLGEKPAADAGKFLQYLTERKIPSYIISNSTLRTGDDVLTYLEGNNINFDVPAMTAVDATLHYVKEHYSKVSVHCIPSIKKLFKDFINDENPEAIVIGDIGDTWNYKLMNEIFRKVKGGIPLVAMHYNRFWYPDGENQSLDAGAFIKAIEYGAERESILIGKPSPLYFRAALRLLGFSADDEFFMIGDDLENDIIAAQKIGGRGALIYTGKTDYPLTGNQNLKPDLEINSLTEMIDILEKVI